LLQNPISYELKVAGELVGNMHDYVWLLVPKMSSFKSKTSRKGFMQIVNSASFAKVKKKGRESGRESSCERDLRDNSQ